MRTKLSIINVSVSYIASALAMIIGFITQAIFLENLNESYLGINGLFTNIVSMLSIVELGIGTAIIYNLYKPISVGDKEKIKSLVNYYKKTYRKIAIIIFLIGLLVIPFLSYIVGKTDIKENINLIYLLFLLDTSIYYLISYKRTILIANSKSYHVNIVHIFYLVIVNSLQIFILFKYQDYYLYLIIKFIMRIVENIVINIIANKNYGYLKEKNINALDISIIKDIKLKIKSLFFHKIGTFIVSGTDNILISMFFGINSVGLYSNYFLITNSVSGFFLQAFSTLTSTVGNLLVTSDVKHQKKVYNRILFLNAWIAVFTSSAILVIIETFIKLWIGEQYILSFSILIVIIINFYFNSMRMTYNVFKDAAGIYYEDRFIPIYESICNIIFSILFAKLFGLVGIFIGTISSQLILHLYSYPKYVVNKLFSISYGEYLKKFLTYLLIFIASSFISYCVSILYVFPSVILNLIVRLLIAIVVPNIIMIIVFRKSEEFMYYMNLLKRILKKYKNNGLLFKNKKNSI